MNHSSINALVSMQNVQKKLDLIANNIANLNTVGYKQKDADFEAVLTSTIQQPDNFIQKGRVTPAGFTQGWGAKLSSLNLDMTEGSLDKTGLKTDLALQGNGLFEVSVSGKDANGNVTKQTAWTRNGAFQLSPYDADNSALVTKAGSFVKGVDDQPILIPNHSEIRIDREGRVWAKDKRDPQGYEQVVGQVKLVQVFKPDLLKNMGNNLYGLSETNNPNNPILSVYDPTQETGEPQITVQSGMLEHSNVNLSKQMSDLLVMERSYQLNSRSIASADTMMNLANHLNG